MKRFKISILILALLGSFSSQSQVYTSNFEKEIFDSFKKDSLNYSFFESLFAIDSSLTHEHALKHKEEVLSLIRTFPEKEANAKKEKKRVKFIYDELHDKFFKKYNLDSNFNDVFKDGTYNCVTASALYTFAFDELKIPYHIKETPAHVFLIAYPTSHKIYLETTVPGAYGFIIPKESEVKKILDELIAYKLVTEAEVLEKGYMKFYEDYYYGKEFIEKKALIGMQYYNKGLTNFQNVDYDKSINNFRKAKVFYTSPLINPFLKNIMFLKVNELKFNSIEDVDFLLELLSISKYPDDYSISNLKSTLFKLVDHDENDTDFIEQAISKFMSVKNEIIRNEAIEFLYEYLARNAATDEELDKALSYSDKIMNVNPISKIAKQIIEYVSFKKVQLSTFDLETLQSFESACEKYSFLKESKRYHINLVHLYGNISLISFGNKSIEKGKDYLQKLEDILDNTDVLEEVNKNLLAEVYLKAGNYYYYKDQYNSSYKIFSKGLTYVPNNNDLIKKAKWSKEEI